MVLELKGTKTIFTIKEYFFKQIKDLDFGIYSLVLNKRRVYEYLIKEKSWVYNVGCRRQICFPTLYLRSTNAGERSGTI